MPRIRMRGRVITGLGHGAAFTRLPWAREQFQARLGIDPHPGTLNMQVDDPANLSAWRSLRTRPAERILPPDKTSCAARCYPITIEGGIHGAVVLPEVEGYPVTQVEVIAALPLREKLRLRDGDPLVIEAGNIPPLLGVIFDVDGTLVDSIGAYHVAASRAAADRGFTVPADAIRVALNGGPPFWHLVVPEQHRSSELIAALREDTMRYWPEVLKDSVTVFPGIETTVMRLRAGGLRLAIYTGSHGESLPPLQNSGLMTQFDAVLTASDVTQRKPHPEGLLRCLQIMGLAAAEVAYVGDSVQDIQAARAAGMIAIGLLSGTADSALMSAAGPDRILQDHSRLPELLLRGGQVGMPHPD